MSELLQQLAAKGKHKRLFDKIEKQLSAYLEGEERVVYKRFENEQAAHDVVLDGYEARRLVKRLLGELEHGEDDDTWRALLKVMTDLVQHHVEEEEEQFFLEARRLVDAQQAEQLGEQFEERKKAA